MAVSETEDTPGEVLESARLAAMVSLIADPSPMIREATSLAVLEAGDVVIPHLAFACAGAPARLRARARLLMSELRCRALVRSFDELPGALGDPRSLERAVVLLVQNRDSSFPAEQIHRVLRGFAAELAPKLSPADGARGLAERLRRAFVTDWGFQGGGLNAFAEENCYLDQVLDRRRGNPIVLGAICLFVTRRLGLQIEAFGGAGRFLLRMPGASTVLFDLDGEGSISSSEVGLRRLSDLDILIRMIGNLQAASRSRGDTATLHSLHRLRRALDSNASVTGA